MPTIPDHFRLNFEPLASTDAVIQFDTVRFTMLTDRLLRLEYHPQGKFEDRATQAIWYRQQPVPQFTARQAAETLEIETEYLFLKYQPNGDAGFSAQNLQIHVKATDTAWHPGMSADDNLRGTTRTLDFINGYAPLGTGLISRAGWSVLDDSASLVFNEDCWLEPRNNGGVDWYFFGYGHDYKACLQDYCKISGNIPLIPRWILGNWWSRYWAYTQDDLQQLLCDFEAQEIPLSVCIVDMDWHLTKTGNTSTGWTGYTWNRDLFPNPEGFFEFVHARGIRTALNLHPAEGIHPHEEQYPAMAQRLGIDPATGKPIAFDITDPEFVNAYFELLHHPNEAIGVDFWWVDWQQGQKSRMEGLDPLWLINHLHFHDSGRDGVKRPFIFSRWGNEGHQRYPIGFSGDSYMTWETLRFQPYMTATASNVAYGYWSHDIGGHISGTGDAELFTRWLQFGVFSPIMRIHSGKGHFYERHPWTFDDAEVLNVLREAMQLRHQFLPYLYTMARRAHDDSLPLMLPMYYEYPESEAAYHCPQQYLFGTQLIAAPFVEPKDADTRLSRQVVWLPEGDWYHFFTGEHYTGNSWHAVYGALKDIPLFAKAGAIVPLGAWDNINHPDDLHIHVFAGAYNSFTLYEDDGESTAYQNGHFCETMMTQQFDSQHLIFTIEAAQGNTSVIPAERQISLLIHGVTNDVIFLATIDDNVVDIVTAYDSQTETLHITGLTLPATSTLEVIVQVNGESILAHRNRQRETVLRLLKAFRLNAGVRNHLADNLDAIMTNPEKIAPYLLPMRDAQARALFEVLFEAGVQVVHDTHQPTLIVLWNNREDAAITYRYADAYLYFGHVQWLNHQNGIMPRFMALTPTIKTWTHGAAREHVQQTQWSAQVDYRNLLTVVESHREETP
jgi:alpha-glucosidase (family GH31 glycosyl hydrolase)